MNKLRKDQRCNWNGWRVFKILTIGGIWVLNDDVVLNCRDETSIKSQWYADLHQDLYGWEDFTITRQVRSKSSEKLQLSSNKPAAITTSRKGAQIANIAQFWTLSKLLTMLHLAYLLCVNFWHLYFSLSKKVITRQSQHVIIVALPALLTVNRGSPYFSQRFKIEKTSIRGFSN